MAITFNWDPLDFPMRGKKTNAGWEIERTAHVMGLTGYTTFQAMMSDAVDTVGVDIGDSLDGPITFCACTSIEPQTHTLATDQLFIRYNFKQTGVVPIGSELGEVTINSQAQQFQSNFDATGDPIKLDYNGKTIVGQISKYLPVGTVQIRRNEEDNPAWKVTFVGTTNAGGWAYDPSATDNTWLCDSISSSLAKDGTWDVQYTFAYKEQEVAGTKHGWDVRVFYTDSTGQYAGKQRDDLVEGTTASGPGGKKWIHAHPMQDWSSIFD